MRIGFDAKRAFYNSTGLGHYSRNVIAALEQYFPEEDYFLFTPKGDTLDFKPVNATTIYPDGGWNLTWRSYGIIRQLVKNNIDIYHGLSNEIPFSLPPSAIPSVVTIHDVIFKRYPSAYSFIDRNIYNKKTRFSVKNASKIVVSSRSTAHDITRYYGGDPELMEVVFPPLNPIFYKPSEEVELPSNWNLPKQFMLFVGTGNERKNLEFVVEMLLRTSPSQRFPCVVVGGNSTYLKRMKGIISKKQLVPNFIFIESCSDQQLRKLYDYATALIYPSRYEGFGMPVAEALLCGLPVIASDVSSIPEAGGEAALYCSPDQPDQAIEHLEVVLNDVAWKQEFIQKAKAHVALFQHELIAKQLMTVYQNLL